MLFALPQAWSFANLAQVWTETRFTRYLANSALVTAASVAMILASGTMAAYAIAAIASAATRPSICSSSQADGAVEAGDHPALNS